MPCKQANDESYNSSTTIRARVTQMNAANVLLDKAHNSRKKELTFQEQSILQSSPMLDLVISLERHVQVLHAERHMRISDRINLIHRELVDARAIRKVIANELLVDIGQEGANALVRGDDVEEVRGLHECAG